MPSGYIEKLDGTKIEIVDAKSRADILTKQDKLLAGENINITGNTISADEPTIVQTITSGVEIGKINDTSLYVNEINYVDADVDSDGNIVLFGGNSDDGNVGDGISALQSVINGKYAKPTGGIPKSDLSEEIQKKLSDWELILDVTLEEESAFDVSFDTLKDMVFLVYEPVGITSQAGWARLYNGDTLVNSICWVGAQTNTTVHHSFVAQKFGSDNMYYYIFNGWGSGSSSTNMCMLNPTGISKTSHKINRLVFPTCGAATNLKIWGIKE